MHQGEGSVSFLRNCRNPQKVLFLAEYRFLRLPNKEEMALVDWLGKYRFCNSLLLMISDMNLRILTQTSSFAACSLGTSAFIWSQGCWMATFFASFFIYCQDNLQNGFFFMRQGCYSCSNLSKAYLQVDWVKSCSDDSTCLRFLRLFRHYSRDAPMHTSRQSTSFCQTICLKCFLCDLRSISSSRITNQYWLIQQGKCSLMKSLLFLQFYQINQALFSLYSFNCCSLYSSFDISSNS